MNWTKRNLAVNWHPYTQMKDCETHPPVLIERAEGLKLFDENGQYYYDTISSWWCNILGHNVPELNDALTKQLKDFGHVMFGGFTHKPAITLSEKLVAMTPNGCERIFYSDNGSTAIEVALKMSIQYWQHQGQPNKNKFISFQGAYHGDTIGAMSVSGVDLFHKTFEAICFTAYKTPIPSAAHTQQSAITQFETLVQKNHTHIAGFIFEPLLMGAGGMKHYSPHFLARLVEICKTYNIHTIADEIATGFGRTGTLFACNQAKIEPDFLCLSKALTNGTLPLAVTCTSTKIYNAFYADYNEHKTFYHGHTFTANALGCSIANATLDIIQTQNLGTQGAIIETQLRALSAPLQANPTVQNLRFLGSTLAFELKNPKTQAPYPDELRMGYKLFQIGKKHHVILRPLGNTIYLFLPLICTQDHLQDILTQTQTSINALQKELA